MPYIVGEVGPELFIPNTSGEIIPNNRITLASSGERGNILTPEQVNEATSFGTAAGTGGGTGFTTTSTSIDMIKGLEMGMLHQMPHVNRALLQSANGLYDVFGDTMLTRNPDLMKLWNMMWKDISMESEENLLAMGAGYEDFFEIMSDQFRDGYATISGETIEILDFMMTNMDVTKEEMIAILEALGVEATEGWAHYMGLMGDTTEEGFTGIIGEADRGMRGFNQTVFEGIQYTDEMLKESYANMLKYWENAQSIFGGDSPITGRLPGWEDLFPPDQPYMPSPAPDPGGTWHTDEYGMPVKTYPGVPVPQLAGSTSRVYYNQRGGDTNYISIQNSAAWATWHEQQLQNEFDDIDRMI